MGEFFFITIELSEDSAIIDKSLSEYFKSTNYSFNLETRQLYGK